MRRGQLPRRAITGAVLGAGLVVALVPGAGEPAAQGDRAPATVPDRMAHYSYLTGDVSSSPPGRAIALFQFGFGVEFMDFPQAVVVSADGDDTRRVDLAEDRAGPETQGDPAPMLLSPDGRLVAVGDHDADQPDIAVLDLASGDVDTHPVPAGRSVRPAAWSPDGGQLAYLGAATPTNPYSGAPLTGDVGLLDLTSGRAGTLPGATGVQSLAFAPDGTELAVQRSGATGGDLDVVPLAGGTGRSLDLPPGHRLGGNAAWSPDGALLAVSSTQGDIAFVDATGRSGPTPEPLDDAVVGSRPVVGWTAPDRVVVLVPDPPSSFEPDYYELLEVTLDDGAVRPLSAVPTRGGNYGVGHFELATGLLADLEVREAGDVDRGRWPVWLRLGAAVAAAAAAAWAVQLLNRRARPPSPAR